MKSNIIFSLCSNNCLCTLYAFFIHFLVLPYRKFNSKNFFYIYRINHKPIETDLISLLKAIKLLYVNILKLLKLNLKKNYSYLIRHALVLEQAGNSRGHRYNYQNPC